MKFSHLHVHSQYSLLDGAASLDSLLKKATKDNMPALAITDHGNMFGIFEFVANAWKDTITVGTEVRPRILPIVGCEFYLVKDHSAKVFTKDLKDVRYHQLLLAKNEQGYKNLVKLTSLGFIAGMYGKYPRIDKQQVEQYHEGLIATTCCLGASVPQAILTAGEEKAEIEFRWWHELFGDDYFVELQRHGLPEQEKVNKVLIRFAEKYNVPIIASNDSHYTNRDDYNAHDILLCINTGEKQATPGYDDFVNDDVQVKNRRFKFPNDQFYFKTTEEMVKLFHDIPQAIDNTNLIVDRVKPLKLTKDILLPNFPIPDAFKTEKEDVLNQWLYLRHLTYEGAKARYDEVTPLVQERLDFELNTIRNMGFAGYFLIVSDFIRHGREVGVFIGPGRGSAAGSAVAFCIGITNIDPIKYNLLFERFLNPDRKSMPDIDTDFDDDGRQRVIDYVVEKYGSNQVAQIITYGTMAAKSSIKDVARVTDLPLPEANALAKLVPDKPGTSLRKMLHAPLTAKDAKDGEKSLDVDYMPDDISNVARLREIYNGNDLRSKVLKEAERLEGSVRNTGIHAAGIIIAPRDLTDLIPVASSKESTLWLTQIEGEKIESAGVIKMDFLGLKTLSILKTALNLIEQNHKVRIDLDNLPLDDELTYRLYQKGDTNGTFQFESAGMQKYLRELKPDRFSDLIAMNALYRPGPIAYIPKYIARKHGREKIEYDLPEMEEYLSDTYGITVYQEQVMLLSQKIAGFSKGDADVLRKAMGKKDEKTLEKKKDQFMDGASAKGFAAQTLEKIWSDWKAFAQYAFNKSHSTCYALVAYQTGYLKAHYPSEYMSAVLNHQDNIEKITFHMEECRRMGIKVLGPDINESLKGFAPNKKGEIRFGFGGLKGVGDNAIDNIITERQQNGPYTDIFNFITRVNQRSVNKRSMESLAYSGSFDCFTALTRAQYFYTPPEDNMNGLERITGYGQVKESLNANTTNTLFGDLAEVMIVPPPKIPTCEPWPLTVQLGFEKEVTGMFLSGHPLDNYRFEFDHYGFISISDFNEIKESATLSSAKAGQMIRLGGLVTDAQFRTTKNGKEFGILNIEDYQGKTEIALFGEDYAKYKNYMEKGMKLAVQGTFRSRYNNSEEFEFKPSNIYLLETVKASLTKGIELKINPSAITEKMIAFFEQNLKNNPGNMGLKIVVSDPIENISVNLSLPDNRFRINDEFTDYLMENVDVEVSVTRG